MAKDDGAAQRQQALELSKQSMLIQQEAIAQQRYDAIKLQKQSLYESRQQNLYNEQRTIASSRIVKQNEENKIKAAEKKSLLDRQAFVFASGDIGFGLVDAFLGLSLTDNSIFSQSVASLIDNQYKINQGNLAELASLEKPINEHDVLATRSEFDTFGTIEKNKFGNSLPAYNPDNDPDVIEARNARDKAKQNLAPPPQMIDKNTGTGFASQKFGVTFKLA